MEFRDRLKQVMIYRDIKTQELADKSGVNKRTIDHYLMSDSQEPSVSKAVKIATALDVSVEYLVTGREQGDRLPPSRELRELIKDFSALPPRQKSAVLQVVHLLADPFVRDKEPERPNQEFSR
ncbi:MAG: helix-turn-helix domain-containing protein [Treponema sp.]|nr:helix-turn-helix domain-containing protein [Treponema sp.]